MGVFSIIIATKASFMKKIQELLKVTVTTLNHYKM